jgi:hypothetical protein
VNGAKPRILLQLDSDEHASVFDAVVAIDAGVDQLFTRGGVEPQQVRDLVHGAIFTRGPADLKNTAIFIGGADVAAGEELLRQVIGSFFGPMRVSVMLDANGANTTASAAVLCAARHVTLADVTALVLAGTGPVGQRAALLLASQGAAVRLASRNLDRAKSACAAVTSQLKAPPAKPLTPVSTATEAELKSALVGAQVIIGAGAAGVELLSESQRKACDSLRVMIDLNAVPPAGLAGVRAQDSAKERDGIMGYGAIGVGGLKMKIHKAALRKLFESNEQVLDAAEIFALGRELAQ